MGSDPPVTDTQEFTLTRVASHRIMAATGSSSANYREPLRMQRLLRLTPMHTIESERRTRKSRIDPKLKAWGWEIVPFE